MNQNIPHVDPQQEGLTNSPIAETESAGTNSPYCYWNGQPYTLGAYVCSGNQKMQCTRVADGPPFWINAGNC
jgi:hypothetical protein